jgi:dipeptidyl aminopeptidase/acylaminoacyl peptidase
MKKLLLLLNVAWLGSAALAQTDLGYQRPPQAMADLIDAPATPAVSVDATGTWLLLLNQAELPSIAELAQPELRLAGLRINPATNGPSRAAYSTGLKLKKLPDGPETPVQGLPANPLISNATWSPNQQKIALTLTLPTKLELWVVDVPTATARRLTDLALNGAYAFAPFRWLSDSQGLLALTVPAGRGNPPAPSLAPAGPVVQENLGRRAPSRTYQDLLKNPADEKIFEYYATSQLTRLGLDGPAQPLGSPQLIQNFNPSPDGTLVLLNTTQRPFSYLVTAGSFPLRVDVLATTDGGRLVKNLANLPLRDNLPLGFDAVATGQRGHSWRADAPATVVWAEAQDGGDPKKEAAIRDKVFALDAPFAAAPTELVATQYRYAGITWGNAAVALVNEYWWATRKEVVRLLNPTARTSSVLFDRSSEDTYTDPGSPETRLNSYGRPVLALDKAGQVLLFGQGASPEGDRPFVDRFNLLTKKTERLWRSEAPYFERPVSVLDEAKMWVLTVRESQTEPPNYFLRDLKKKTLKPVTNFPHPYPQLKEVTKQLLKYKRPDGVELSTTLYLPAGYKKEQGPLPTFLWAYPEEFKNKAAAGQVSGSPHRFTRLNWGSPIFWVTQGYAILDNASIPIVGEGDKEPNDTYVEQLVASAKAAIDEGARLGVVDPNRVAAGGHSYGAFMTANLLANSNLFKAGIARSGAYNRTLTPFGFQSEERTYWQAPEVYNRMSPFMYADKLKIPILLIHGEADNNPGTFPLQTERFYNALKGHGATARFVLLPHESHGYRARESVHHMLWEMHQWLEKYVKNAAPAAATGGR